MTNRAFLLLGFLFILLISIVPAHAETIPSTYTPPAGSSGSSGYAAEITPGYNCGGGTIRSTKDSACDNGSGSYYAGRVLGADSVYVTENGVPIYQTECKSSSTTILCQVRPSIAGTCPSGMASSGAWTCSGSCPSGQEIVNGVCTSGTYSCPADYIISADQQTCTKVNCPAGDIASKGVYYGETVTSPACYNGCAATYSGQAPWDSASGWIYIGQYKNTGQTCSEASNPPAADVPTPPESTDPPTTAEYDCVSKGMSYGSVNGVTVCVPSGTPDTPPMVESPQTNTKTEPDGTTTETQTQDVQSGTNITRNTTVIVRDAQGNIVSQETSSITSTEGAFCEENPNSSVCAQSKTSGGGNCDTPPSSEGDAIQAAILKQAWETRCQVKKTNQALGEGSTRATELAGIGDAAMTGEAADLSGQTETVDVSGQISTAKFLSGGCIPDKVITGLPQGKTLTIPFSDLCPYLEIFGNVMIIISMLAAARITGVF